jgi:non-specific serine/threonine protein kinase
MRDAIVWSHDLLTPSDQALFRRLAVFVGGFTLDAAEAVCGDRKTRTGSWEEHDHPAPDSPLPTPGSVLDGIASLVDKSLVRRLDSSVGGAYPARTDTGDPRFGMLETIREFGLEHLAASGEALEVRHAHAAYYLTLAEQADPHLLLPGQEPWLVRLEAENANLRAALDWLEQAEDAETFLRLAGSLRFFWYVRGYYGEGTRRLDRALARAQDGPPAIRVRALTGLGLLLAYRVDASGADVPLTESLALAQATDDHWETALALVVLGLAAMYRGDHDLAEAYGQDALGRYRRMVTDPRAPAWVCMVLHNLGVVAYAREDLSLAATRFDEALVREREIQFSWLAGITQANLGNVARDRGDHARALSCYREALALGKAHGDKRILAIAVDGAAGVAMARGQAERAGRLFGAAAALREEAGIPVDAPLLRAWERGMAATRTAVGEAAFAAALATGRAVPLEASVAEVAALTKEVDAKEVAIDEGEAAATYGLTTREMDVLRLLAAGRTDREIAETLFLSSRTVNTHTARIYAKLGVGSRAEAAAWAVRHGIA